MEIVTLTADNTTKHRISLCTDCRRKKGQTFAFRTDFHLKENVARQHKQKTKNVAAHIS